MMESAGGSSSSSITKLKGKENYPAWSTKMEALLDKLDLYQHIEQSSEHKDLKGEALDKWKKADRRTKTEIVLALSDDIVHIVPRNATAKDAWFLLQNEYESRDSNNTVASLVSFLSTTFKEGDDMRKHLNTITRHRTVIQEMMDQDDFIEKLHIAAILKSLPLSFESTVKAIHVHGTGKMRAEEVNNILIQEVQRSEAMGEGKQPATPAAYNVQKSVAKIRTPCAHCKRKTHKPEDCWELESNAQHRPRNWRSVKEGRSGNNVASSIVALAYTLDPEDRVKVLNALQDSTYTSLPSPSSPTIFNCSRTQQWIIDSGASDHVTGEKSWFREYQAITPITLYTADKRPLRAIGQGKIDLQLQGGETLTLTNVLYVPGFPKHLLSISQELRKGGHILFKDGGKVYYIAPEDQQDWWKYSSDPPFTHIGTQIGNLFYANGTTIEPHQENAKTLCATSSSKDAINGVSARSITLWHQRLGHLNTADIRELAKSAKGIRLSSSSHMPFCEGCAIGKITRQRFPKKANKRASQPLELVHTDVGVVNVPSWQGHRYYVVFVDDYSRRVFLYLLKKKSEVMAALRQFVQMAETQTDLRLKRLRSDRGGEYCSAEMKAYCDERGIIHELSAPYSPSQNGVAERRQRTLVESARCMLLASGLPYKLWTEALSAAVHIGNKSPTSALDGLTPHEKWFGTPPDVGYLRVFGCVSYGLIPKHDRRKLYPKAKKYALVGYGSHSKAYRLYDFTTQTVIERRDVLFDETTTASAVDCAGSAENDAIVFDILNNNEDSCSQPGNTDWEPTIDIHDGLPQDEDAPPPDSSSSQPLPDNGFAADFSLGSSSEEESESSQAESDLSFDSSDSEVDGPGNTNTGEEDDDEICYL
jgi:transposase InsO family protein